MTLQGTPCDCDRLVRIPAARQDIHNVWWVQMQPLGHHLRIPDEFVETCDPVMLLGSRRSRPPRAKTHAIYSLPIDWLGHDLAWLFAGVSEQNGYASFYNQQMRPGIVMPKYVGGSVGSILRVVLVSRRYMSCMPMGRKLIKTCFSRFALGSSFLWLFFAVCFLPNAALAAPAAEELIMQGLELRRAGRDIDALAKFEAAYKLLKTPRAAAQWGLCLQAVARWSEADPLLSEALTSAADPWIKKNRGTLKDSLETVKSHVGRIEIVGDPAGAIVTIGGRRVGKLPLSGAVAVNEGSVDIELTADGYSPSVRTLMVAGASYQNVVLRLQKIPAVPSTSVSAMPLQDQSLTSSPTPAEAAPDQSVFRSPWLWVGLGVVVAAGITALALSASSGDNYLPSGQLRDVQ
jgi:hypothetical protein